jgi:phosphoribosylformimino-5-aminoimidazole carboxamide ribotide isomerase
VQIIPVIDLMGGHVVHARRGERQNYQPLQSPLCAGSRPADVVAGYLTVHPFTTVYIADLDAIRGQGDSGADIAGLRRAFPTLRFWIDNGLASAADCRAWLARDLGDLVLGSEAQRDAEILRDVAGDRVILSLDFKDGAFLGPPALLADSGAWPGRVIVMTLSRVGSDSGPDVALLDRIHGRAGSRSVFAAGGVRGGEDLLELQRRGIAGVLVASALHAGRIGGGEIAALSRRRTDASRSPSSR